VFRAQKRLADWLQVAARVAAHRKDVTFLLVGGGPLEAEVRAQIDALGLKHCVRAPGFRQDGRRLMGAMDVFLMTSEFEGLPIALLEAMSLGKPVVSTRVGGIPEVLEDGVTGFLSPVGAVDELADRVMRLLDDDVLQARFGRAAETKIETTYHVKRRVAAIEHLYHEVLEEAA
jgi:glycosyltransferase involved in cell wall biosynthesis